MINFKLKKVTFEVIKISLDKTVLFSFNKEPNFGCTFYF